MTTITPTSTTEEIHFSDGVWNLDQNTFRSTTLHNPSIPDTGYEFQHLISIVNQTQLEQTELYNLFQIYQRILNYENSKGFIFLTRNGTQGKSRLVELTKKHLSYYFNNLQIIH